jgi:hypothetical protein
MEWAGERRGAFLPGGSVTWVGKRAAVVRAVGRVKLLDPLLKNNYVLAVTGSAVVAEPDALTSSLAITCY